MAEVKIQEGESIESALRRFKRKVQQEDIIKRHQEAFVLLEAPATSGGQNRRSRGDGIVRNSGVSWSSQ